MIERFSSKVLRHKNGCWQWTASVRKDGYGRFRVGGRTMLAHRVAYMLYTGPLSKKLDIIHSCDNPGCVNPEHLRAGTHGDNMADKIRKGRDHNQRKTHCPQGHPYNSVNTRSWRGSRICRTCQGAKRC